MHDGPGGGLSERGRVDARFTVERRADARLRLAPQLLAFDDGGGVGEALAREWMGVNLNCLNDLCPTGRF